MGNSVSGFVAVLVATAALNGGCNKAVPTETLVSGVVRFRKKPADGVYVLLHKDRNPDAAADATARTGKDGTFVVSVSEPGAYAVTVFWPTTTNVDGSVEEGADRFNYRYRDPQQPLAEIDVHEGSNQLEPLEVK
ncbi:hypothetical protein LOC68_15675 [Blastopirellula sp. JC732]|uniref:Carboxypeptidase regulatory-like domain-containing protein n=1 Tax=Blastopirellula sediminis TaxID=2894196 RepID=A0A9X1MNB4_9BACT|nr:hypothetical protein [Blastopirellula sediminis]MCC9606875.1 hypothetical protein [Blastopirellula sediminis]MCC9629829.1 hypothetical protein [Blastopirellula sediminis]